MACGKRESACILYCYTLTTQDPGAILRLSRLRVALSICCCGFSSARDVQHLLLHIAASVRSSLQLLGSGGPGTKCLSSSISRREWAEGRREDEFLYIDLEMHGDERQGME